MEFFQCCRVCGKLSKSELFDGGGFCEDGSTLDPVPSRGGAEWVCGVIKVGYMQYESSPCRLILERWINERIKEGWQGFPTSFPDPRDPWKDPLTL